MNLKDNKVAKQITEKVAEFLLSEANSDPLITVIRTSLFGKGRQATIFISVFPTEKEGLAIKFLDRKKKALGIYLSNNSRIGRIPKIKFELIGLDTRE